MTLPLMLYHRVSWFHLIYVNRSMKFGGMEIDSKSEILNLFSKSAFHLPHTLLPIDKKVSDNLMRCRDFMEKHDLKFPVIAKPDRGCVGYGVRKIHSFDELQTILIRSPITYMVQEYCDYPHEYSIYYQRLPGENRGKVTGLTEKVLPSVTGDGISTVRELLSGDHRYRTNLAALLKHIRQPDLIIAKGVTKEVIIQGSHTYGAIFNDISSLIDVQMSEWVDQVAKLDPLFQLGRFDLRAKTEESLRTGEGIKILEVNGCMSEPIHIYDDHHPLRFGIKEFFRVYNWGFTIAAANRPETGKPPYVEMTKAFHNFFRHKKVVMAEIG